MLTGTVSDLAKAVRRVLKKPSRFFYNVAITGSGIALAFAFYEALVLFAGCDYPVVVVLSGSMEPAVYRGDLLLLRSAENVRVGDVVVFSQNTQAVPIVHRVHAVHEAPGGVTKFLTKGDNNNLNDRGLYLDRKLWIEKQDLIGKAYGIVPSIGMPTIWFNEIPA